MLRQSKIQNQNPKWGWDLAIVLAFVLCGTVAEAQQPAKIPKIGFLGAGSASATGRLELFRREFRKLGYVDGKNVAFEYRFADNKLDRLPALADELVRLKVDVLLASSTPTAALAGKRLELLKETIPKLSRVAVLWNPQNPGNALNWKESQLPARELGLQLHSLAVSSADKYESAFKEATKARSAALTVAQDSLTVSNQKLIADLAEKNRLPAIYLGEILSRAAA